MGEKGFVFFKNFPSGKKKRDLFSLKIFTRKKKKGFVFFKKLFTRKRKKEDFGRIPCRNFQKTETLPSALIQQSLMPDVQGETSLPSQQYCNLFPNLLIYGLLFLKNFKNLILNNINESQHMQSFTGTYSTIHIYIPYA